MRASRQISRRFIRPFAPAIALALFSPFLFLTSESEAQNTETIHWKAITEAQVKLDDKTPLGWNVYQPDKKDKKAAKRLASSVLVLLGHRYLLIDFDARLVYEVPKPSLHAQGQDFETADPPADAHEIPSTDWTLRDVGPAELIRFTLGDYGRTVEVSLPHPPDMRPFY